MKKILAKLLSCTLLCSTLLSAIPAFSSEKVDNSSDRKKAIVYFPNWGVYDDSHQRLTPDKLPWDKLDVINHSFFTINNSFQLTTLDSYADFEMDLPHSAGWNNPSGLSGCFGEYQYYAKEYPNTKIMVSVGGWTRGENFHAMAKTEATRKTFIQSCIKFMEKYPFISGIDLDWEYPGIDRKPESNNQWDKGCPGGPEDTENYTLLLKEMREQFNAANMKEKWITVCVPAGYDKMQFQQLDKIHQYVNLMNVMTYDFHGSWDNSTGHLAPLTSNPNDNSSTTPIDIKNRYNVSSAISTLVNDYKVPSSKLTIGTPWYSRGWAGVNPNEGINGMFASTNGSNLPGSWDEAATPSGQNSWFKMKELETTTGWTKYRDEYNKSPWLYNKDKGYVLTYEDEESMALKCKFIREMDLAGMIVWEISGDNASKGFPMSSLLRTELDKSKDNNNTITEAPTLSVDNKDNHGSFDLTISVPLFSKGTSVDILENGKVIKTLSVDSAAASNYNYSITGKDTGKYEYKAILKNEISSKESNILTINVIDATLLKPILKVDNKVNRGAYTIEAISPANSSAIKMELYENDKLIKSLDLQETLNKEQSLTHKETAKGTGSYNYKVLVKDSKGTSLEENLTVTVDSNANIMPDDIKVEFKVTSDWGSGANYSINITNNSKVDILDYSLEFKCDKKIQSCWSAGSFTSEGNKYKITPPTWSKSIKAGTTVSLGGALEGNSIGTEIYAITLDYKVDGTTPPVIPPTSTLKAASLSVDNNSNKGDYKLTITIPKNNEATSVKIYENDTLIKEESLSANSNSDKVLTLAKTNMKTGKYNYKAVVSNGTKTLDSNLLTVTVDTNSSEGGGSGGENNNLWVPYTSYKVGDIVTYNNKKYQCIQPHQSLNGWEPTNVPALWKVL
ncbi:MAG: glycosyl hydrolase family 18 protein [Sarcina sp.]